MTDTGSRKSARRNPAAGKTQARAAPLGLAGFDDFCRSLPHTTFVKQWGDAHVWKIGGKVFVIARDDEEGFRASFKCSDLAFQVLSDQPGCQPAPYLASRGMKWIQRFGPETLDDATFLEHIEASYHMIADALPKTLQVELGLIGDRGNARRPATPRHTIATGRPKPRKG